jgi:hypothetical protein
MPAADRLNQSIDSCAGATDQFKEWMDVQGEQIWDDHPSDSADPI